MKFGEKIERVGERGGKKGADDDGFCMQEDLSLLYVFGLGWVHSLTRNLNGK